MTTKHAAKPAHASPGRAPAQARPAASTQPGMKSNDSNSRTSAPSHDAPKEYLSGNPEPHGNHK